MKDKRYGRTYTDKQTDARAQTYKHNTQTRRKKTDKSTALES